MAALIGIFTGSVLYFCCKIIISVFNLQTVHGDERRQPVSLPAQQDRKRFEDAWDAATPKLPYAGGPKLEENLASEYAVLSSKDLGKKKESQGLLSQTILEEDDDSEDGF